MTDCRTITQKTFRIAKPPRGEDIAAWVSEHDLYGWTLKIVPPGPETGYYNVHFILEEK